MTRPYYTLFVREDDSWSYEFGDYERNAVISEQQEWLDHFDYKDRRRFKKDSVVLTLKSADQWRIDNILNALNAMDPSVSVTALITLKL
jgi:hypothetical protein